MQSHELAKRLLAMENVDVGIMYDGGVRMDADVCYASKGGSIVITGYDQRCYYDEDRPKSAPKPKDDKYWRIDQDLNLIDEEI